MKLLLIASLAGADRWSQVQIPIRQKDAAASRPAAAEKSPLGRSL